MWPLLLSVILVLLAVVYRRATRFYGSLEALGIPVVKPFLCFGSVPIHKHEVKFYEEDIKMHHNLGKPKAWGYYEGSMPTITIMDQAMIKGVIVKHFDAFRERLTPSFHIENRYLSLDSAGGEQWKSLRKFLSATFTSGKIKGMVQPIEHQVDKFIDHIRGQIEGSKR